MAQVSRFVPKARRIQREVAVELTAQLDLFPPDQLHPHVREAMLNAMHRFVHDDHAEGLWPGGFTMISRAQTGAIWKTIRALPPADRPHQVLYAFNLILLNLRQDTGEVMLTRDQFADEIGCTPNHVTNIMATLDRLGVIRRERRKVAGVRGLGMVVYFINPHVAWNGSLDARRLEAAPTPPPALRLLNGGTSPAASPPA